jgi:hypothetical protein
VHLLVLMKIFDLRMHGVNIGRVVNVRGMLSCTERTLGKTEMSLSTENYETTHIFHVVGDGIRILYDMIRYWVKTFSQVRRLKLILRKEKL